LCLTINALKKAGIAMLNEAQDPIFSRKTRNPTRYSGANTSSSFDKQVFQLLPNDTDQARLFVVACIRLVRRFISMLEAR
jgi:hypothetical protein